MWEYCNSDTKPKLIEVIDGLTRVRKNIKEIEYKSGEETLTHYEYYEARYTQEEFETYKEIARNRSLVDWIALETGIDLPEEE